MKTILKITVAAGVLALMAPDANAIFGTWRRAGRTAVVMESMNAGKSQQSQQQSATAAQQSATAAQQSATAAHPTTTSAPTPSAAPVTAGGKLPLGAVVSALPPGCVSTPVNGVEYYYGGGNFYRAVFQGNTLVYVTADPTK